VAKIIGLPEHEREKSFVLFLGLLAVADGRRRKTACAAGCTHWWHRDLSDPDVVRSTLEDFSRGKAR
jgi:hypothetical protein